MPRAASPGKTGAIARLAKNVDPAAFEHSLRLAVSARKIGRAREALKPVPTLMEWATEHRRIRGRPFSLDRFPPLRELYGQDAALHPDVVIVKAAQRGASEWAINNALYFLDVGRFLLTGDAAAGLPPYDGLNVGYLFPTKSALYDFSKERIMPLRDESERLAALFGNAGGGYEALNFLQVGRASFAYLRGMGSINDLRSFSADKLFYDEFDRHSPVMVTISRSRLAESDLGHQAKLSTPSFPKYGIAAAYDASDRRKWIVACSHASCAWSGEHDFYRDVYADGQPFATWKGWRDEAIKAARFAVVCPSCARETEHWKEGAWTATNPEGAAVRGYHVPWYGFPFARLNDVAVGVASANPSVREVAINEGLGLPFASSGSRVARDAILNCAVDPYPAGGWSRVVMGVDVGTDLHACVAARRDGDKRLWVRETFAVSTFDELANAVKRYNPSRVAVDVEPEIKATAAFADRFPGKVFRADVAEGDAALLANWYSVKTRDGRPTGIVRVSRNQLLDRVFADVTEARLALHPDVANDADFADHLAANHRTVQEDEETGMQEAVWTHTKTDHYAFALGFAILAADMKLPGAAPGVLVQGVGRNRGY